jgi:hypothetical protein
LIGYQLENVERLKDAFKTHRVNRGDARNSRKAVMERATHVRLSRHTLDI